MLQTKRQLIDAAAWMMSPVVVVDERQGSGKATFTLVDEQDESVSAERHELPRALFNGCRGQGLLCQDDNSALNVQGQRVFKVLLEQTDDGQGQEV